ncbi:MAG: hypothetical protein VB032_05030 [Burkholderiaceae bacterium]|nr:hypothetical protein [Burkholderiaceae bacterium]
MKRRTPGKLKGRVIVSEDFDAPMCLQGDDLKKLTCEVVDAGDGSGDLMLQFPPELLVETGWTEGTKLRMEVQDGTLIVCEVDNPPKPVEDGDPA